MEWICLALPLSLVSFLVKHLMYMYADLFLFDIGLTVSVENIEARLSNPMAPNMITYIVSLRANG